MHISQFYRYTIINHYIFLFSVFLYPGNMYTCIDAYGKLIQFHLSSQSLGLPEYYVEFSPFPRAIHMPD